MAAAGPRRVRRSVERGPIRALRSERTRPPLWRDTANDARIPPRARRPMVRDPVVAGRLEAGWNLLVSDESVAVWRFHRRWRYRRACRRGGPLGYFRICGKPL